MKPPAGQTGWPVDAHIIIGKPPTGSRIRLKDAQADDSKDLANQKDPSPPADPLIGKRPALRLFTKAAVRADDEEFSQPHD